MGWVWFGTCRFQFRLKWPVLVLVPTRNLLHCSDSSFRLSTWFWFRNQNRLGEKALERSVADRGFEVVRPLFAKCYRLQIVQLWSASSHVEIEKKKKENRRKKKVGLAWFKMQQLLLLLSWRKRQNEATFEENNKIRFYSPIFFSHLPRCDKSHLNQGQLLTQTTGAVV